MKRWIRIFAPALALAVVLTAGLAALGNNRAGAQPASAPPAALASKVTISEQQAKDAALAANPGTTVVQVELDNEHGVVVYSVALSSGADVAVDATSGQIIGTDQADAQDEAGDAEHEGNEGDEGTETPATPNQP